MKLSSRWSKPAGNLSCPLRKGLNGTSLRTLRFFVVSAVLALAVGVPASASAQTGTPTACFSVTPSSPTTGQTVTFNSSCSTNVAQRGWDLDNDGSYDDGSSTSATKVFATAGTYTIKLGVVNSRGAFDIESKSVVVSNRLPTAAFSFSPATPT